MLIESLPVYCELAVRQWRNVRFKSEKIKALLPLVMAQSRVNVDLLQKELLRLSGELTTVLIRRLMSIWAVLLRGLDYS